MVENLNCAHHVFKSVLSEITLTCMKEIEKALYKRFCRHLLYIRQPCLRIYEETYMCVKRIFLFKQSRYI